MGVFNPNLFSFQQQSVWPLTPPSDWPQGVKWPPPEPENGQFRPPEGWGGSQAQWLAVASDILQGQQTPTQQQSTPSPAPTPQQQAPSTTPTATPAPAATVTTSTPAAQNLPTTANQVYPIPPVFSSSAAYQKDVARFGPVVDWRSASAGPGNDPGKATYQVTYKIDEGSLVTITYGPASVTGGGFVATAVDTSKVSTTAGVDKLKKIAETELAEAQRAVQQGNLQGIDLENAKNRLLQAEREANAANGKGGYTNAELIQQGQQIAGTQNQQVQTQATIANTNLAYVQAIAQILQQKGYSWQQALQLAQNWAIQNAEVDKNNTNLVVNSANTIYNNEVAQRRDDMSTANARLNAAMSGFSDDARSAITINDTLKPGSEKGVGALIGLMGMRKMLGEKYGGFKDFDRITPPDVLDQLGNNTPIRLPSLGTRQDVQDAAREALIAGGMDPDKWPDPGKPEWNLPKPGANASSRPSAGGAANGGRPNTAPTAPAGNNSGQGERGRPGTAGAPTSDAGDGGPVTGQTAREQDPVIGPNGERNSDMILVKPFPGAAVDPRDPWGNRPRWVSRQEYTAEAEKFKGYEVQVAVNIGQYNDLSRMTGARRPDGTVETEMGPSTDITVIQQALNPAGTEYPLGPESPPVLPAYDPPPQPLTNIENNQNLLADVTTPPAAPQQQAIFRPTESVGTDASQRNLAEANAIALADEDERRRRRQQTMQMMQNGVGGPAWINGLMDGTEEPWNAQMYF